MTEDSLKNALYEKIKNHYRSGKNDGWILGVALEPYSMALGFSASNGSRRLRELCEHNSIEKREIKGKRGEMLVEYRWLDPFMPVYPPCKTMKVEGFKSVAETLGF